MEELMNHEVQDLIEKATKIISKTGNRPGTKYPKALKKIVISLRLDHNMSVKDISQKIGVSSYSAREWPKMAKRKTQFNKVSIVNDSKRKMYSKPKLNNNFNTLESISFNLKVLVVLITLLIFQSLIIYLIS